MQKKCVPIPANAPAGAKTKDAGVELFLKEIDSGIFGSFIEGELLHNNHKMLKLMSRLGFASKTSEEDQGIVKVSKAL